MTKHFYVGELQEYVTFPRFIFFHIQTLLGEIYLKGRLYYYEFQLSPDVAFSYLFTNYTPIR